MRLAQDHSPGAYAVSVPCMACGKMHRLADSTMDLDGPAFRAYYCPDHAPKGEVAPCTRLGCTRCPGGREYA